MMGQEEKTERLEVLDSLGLKVKKDPRVALDYQDHLVLLDHQDLRENKEWLV